MCSEVRATQEGIASLGRRFLAKGYHSAFSHSPPASPTFAASPGGVCILVKAPLMIKKLHPPSLQGWRDKGRLVCARVILPTSSMVLICLYGYAWGHPLHNTNEILISDTLYWASGLKCAVLVGGDLNESEHGCSALALARQWGFFHLSGESVTTRGRGALCSKGEPLDHLLGNHIALDMGVTAWVDQERWLSDHFPICAHIRAPNPPPLVWAWPRPMKISGPPVKKIGWDAQPTTIAEWSVCAKKWLAESYEIPVNPCLGVSASALHIPGPPVDKWFQTLASAQRAISRLRNQSVIPEDARRSISRKLQALGLTWKGFAATLSELDQCMTTHLDACQAKAIADWKSRVKRWCVNERDIFQFMRNNPPAKCVCVCVMDDHMRMVTDPAKVFALLNDHWAPIENWESQWDFIEAVELLENNFAMFVPHVPATMEITGGMLSEVIKYMKKGTAPGLDAWSMGELRALPIPCLDALLHVWHQKPFALGRSLAGLVKRIPLHKESGSNDEVPDAKSFRPIDIYSTLVRAISSAQTKSIHWWKTQVLHAGQYASSGGTLGALARINHWVESARAKTTQVWALSIDFSRLFNTICPHLAAKTLPPHHGAGARIS